MAHDESETHHARRMARADAMTRRLLLALGLVALLCGCPKPAPAPGAVPDAGVSVDAGIRDAGAPRVPAPLPGLDALRDAGLELAWVSEASGRPQLWLDGAPLTDGPAGHQLWAALPARAGVVVTATEGGMEELRLVHLDGGIRVLGMASVRSRSPAVSRDGRFLIYESGADGFSDLVRVDLLDGGARAVVAESTGAFQPSLSPDGTWMAYVSSRDGDSEVYRARADGSRPQRLTAFHLEDLSPVVSPDGKWIVFISNREGRDRLFLVRPDGRGARRLHEGPPPAEAGDAGVVEAAEAAPLWSPDSKHVVFMRRAENGFWHLARADVATGAVTALTAGPWDDRQPAMSPDGRHLAFVSTRSGQPQVWLLGPAGEALQVSDDAVAAWLPAFIPPR